MELSKDHGAQNYEIWLKTLELKEDIYATLVKVEDEWYLREFSYDTKNIPFMRI